mmetsp:Transcript_33094/g.65660  ORF Transcript_33094/g.65660 Transcript_33094/m.65660 type:complete len:125 (+) Transcript_33094:138-512(+)
MVNTDDDKSPRTYSTGLLPAEIGEYMTFEWVALRGQNNFKRRSTPSGDECVHRSSSWRLALIFESINTDRREKQELFLMGRSGLYMLYMAWQSSPAALQQVVQHWHSISALSIISPFLATKQSL